MNKLLLGRAESGEVSLLSALANRHGAVTGATGTGKTVTLQRLAEQFSQAGVPVFLADIKGDLSGLARPGTLTPKLAERLKKLEQPEPRFCENPTAFWDVGGEQGHPLRATVSDLGPLLLSRLLGLNDTQEGVLTLAFKLADDEGLLLLDLKDLRALLEHLAERQKELKTKYGNISSASVGAIQRALTTLEEQGADKFFGEPMLEIHDLLRTDSAGRGVINVLAADRLLTTPAVYSCLLLWLLSELFEQLPEVGDQPKPKFVFFFDEAHLLFDDAPKALLDKIELVVRLIRSKGVGVYFVTQSPLDIPESVLGQLGNRIQHALRAFTPRDQKAVRAVAETMRPNPAFDLKSAIVELGVGEALVSFLDEQGRPSVTERLWILSPASQIGPISPGERKALRQSSALGDKYEQVIDRLSAFEALKNRAEGQSSVPQVERAPVARQPKSAPSSRSSGRERQGVFETLAKSMARSVGSTLVREITRGILGSLTGGRKR